MRIDAGAPPTAIPFVKLHSVGNDFVLVEAAALEGRDPGAWAVRACARPTGIGADGLLVLAGGGAEPLDLRMFNPDGTEDFCGNGLRCAVREAHDRGWTGAEGVVRHLGRTVAFRVLPDGRIATAIGRAETAPHAVPLALDHPLLDGDVTAAGRAFRGTAVSTGSTHFVVLTDRLPDDAELAAWGPALEHHPWFPQRTSVMWTRPEGDDRVRLRIWERGLGETLGCGSGSLAAAAVWMRARGRGGSVTVANPGGELVVEAAAWDGDLTATGTAHRLFAGVAPA